MKEKRILFILILLLVSMPVVIAADNETDTTIDTSLSAEAKARDCLDSKLDATTCSDLNFEEKIYAVLGAGKCLSELKDEALNEECWPKDNCNIVDTAKAVIALNHMRQPANVARAWLLSKNTTTGSSLNWYLQIESNPTDCTITYDGSDYSLSIGEDKKLSSSAGSCLTLTSDSYWLQVSSNCYEKEFQITCTNDFSTSTFFKTPGSPIIHLSRAINDGSAGGSATEKINSYCFSESGTECNYEASLWAVFALEGLKDDTVSFIPYLVANMDTSTSDNILAEAFLYYLTSDYEEELLAKKKTAGYWDQSSDRLFDTAFGISVFESTDSRVTNSVEWIEGKQEDGCWNDDIKDTGMVLYYVWPKSHSPSGGTADDDCIANGNYCVPLSSCDVEDILNDYVCGLNARTCCKKDVELETCEEKDGVICDGWEEKCDGYEIENVEKDSSSDICCDGECVEKDSEDDSSGLGDGAGDTCTSEGYECMSSCNEDEGYVVASNYQCESDYELCCKKDEGSLWWLWLLILLIILVILGFVFRDKLQPYYDEHVHPIIIKIQNKFGKGPQQQVQGRRPPFGRRPMPGPPRGMPPRGNPRKILPPSAQRRPTGPKPSRPNSSDDVDDVLKKLKDMGK